MERRREPRIKRRFLVKYGVGSPEKMGFTRDISKTGLYIFSTNPYGAGTVIDMNIDTGDEKFTLRGRVVRAIKYAGRLGAYVKSGMGVEFSRIPVEFIRYMDNLQFTQRYIT